MCAMYVDDYFDLPYEAGMSVRLEDLTSDVDSSNSDDFGIYLDII